MTDAVEDKITKAQVHEALDKHYGHRAAAAAELGITQETLRNRIYKCPDLRRRWGGEDMKPPDSIDVLANRVTPDGEKLAKALEMENNKACKNLSAIGLTDHQVKLAIDFQKTNRHDVSKNLAIINSALMATGLKLYTQIQAVESRLEIVRAYLIQMGTERDEDRMDWVLEEKMLSDQFIMGGDLMRKIMGTSYEGYKNTLLLEYKVNGGGQTKKAKPGYQDIGSEVTK